MMKATRNRTTLSCVFCHQRKQRCNRTLPCSNCIVRGVSNECHYESRKEPKKSKPNFGRPTHKPGDKNRSKVISSAGRAFEFRPAKNQPRKYDDVSILHTDDEWLDYYSSESMSSRETTPPLAISRLGASGIDPFSTFAVDMNSRVDELISHFQEVVGPGLSSLGDGMANNPFKHSWMPYMITSPTLFYATLFTAAVHSEALHKTGPRPDSLLLKSQTINLINEDLQSSMSNISDGTIAASMVIMYTECSVGDLDPILAHQKGIAEMVRLRGGVQNLGLSGVLPALLTSSDRFAAVLTETSPVLRIPQDFNIELPYLNVCLSMDSPISPKSRCLAHDHLALGVSEATGELLDSMRSLTISLLTRVTADPTLKPSSALRAEFLCYQTKLIALPSESDLIDSSNRGDYIYECCRLTAIIYVRSILYGVPFSQAYPPLGLQKLDHAIKKVSLKGWSMAPGVLLWILLVQLPARRFQADKAWYMGLLQKLGAAVGFAKWNDLIKSTDNFIRIQRFVAR